MKQAFTYKPMQPEFIMKSRYVAKTRGQYYYYQFRLGDSEKNSAVVIPDGCIDILIDCNLEFPSGKVCGSVLKSKEIILQPEVDYFGVRFMPGDTNLTENYTMKEIVNSELPFEDVFWSNSNLLEQIISTNSFTDRVALFNSFLDKRNLKESLEILQHSLRLIYLSKGNITTDQVAREIGYSTRYLRKLFESNMGISPKLFCQIVRFQKSLELLMDEGTDSLWSVIVENGYYDQAHIIREFKNFGYITPGQFLNKKLL